MRSHDRRPSRSLQVRVPVATVWTSPEAPREVDRPAILERPDVAGWATAMDPQARRGLVGRTVSQTLLGEIVRVIEHQGDWVRVVCVEQPASGDPRGYPGWMRRSHLAEPVPDMALCASVVRRSARISLSDQSTLELSFGTRLNVTDRGADTAGVLLPGGASGEIALGDVVFPHPAHGRDVLPFARLFLGLHYLWGGTSAWGLDCSGLVHLAYRAVGLAVPRDASDQAEWERTDPVPLASVEAGDLYFFARPGHQVHHVGFASRPFHGDGERWMLHAPEPGRVVEEAPMASHHRTTLVAAGRIHAPSR